MGGGDKSLRTLAGQSIMRRVVDAVRPQVGPLVLNAGGDPGRFGEFGLPVVADVVTDGAGGGLGPLAGVLTGLEWARVHVPAARRVATFATDTPFLPLDLVSRLGRALDGEAADIACARSAGRDHFVFALWPVDLAGALRDALLDEGLRKVEDWAGRYRVARAGFSSDPFDPFLNLNRPEDLVEAERLLAEGHVR
jgi:molybdopterin-guanine dinucleotide biosynthesis protein A